MYWKLGLLSLSINSHTASKKLLSLVHSKKDDILSKLSSIYWENSVV